MIELDRPKLGNPGFQVNQDFPENDVIVLEVQSRLRGRLWGNSAKYYFSDTSIDQYGVYFVIKKNQSV